MLVAERHIIKKGHRFWAEIDNLSWQSKNLYNSANYLIRQNFIYGHGYLTYNQMASLMKDTEQYQALPAKISQQVLRGLDRNWKSFWLFGLCYAMDGGYKGWNPYIERHLAIFVNCF
jgi:putative transposase